MNSNIHGIPTKDKPQELTDYQRLQIFKLKSEIHERQVLMLQSQEILRNKTNEMEGLIDKLIKENSGWVLDRELNWIEEK